MANTDGVGVTEEERSSVTDRDRTRRIVQSAVDVFLSVTLDTPGDRPLNLERLFEELKGGTLPTVREYRARQKSR